MEKRAQRMGLWKDAADIASILMETQKVPRESAQAAPNKVITLIITKDQKPNHIPRPAGKVTTTLDTS